MKEFVKVFGIGFFLGAGICFYIMQPKHPEPPPSGEVTQNAFDQFFQSRKHQFPVVTHAFHVSEVVRVDTIFVRVPAGRAEGFNLLYPDALRISSDQVSLRSWNPALNRWEGQVFSVPEPSRWHLNTEFELTNSLGNGWGGSVAMIGGYRPVSALVRASWHPKLGEQFEFGLRVSF